MQIVTVALENYDTERHISQHNWVNEVTGLAAETKSNISRIRDVSLLTRFDLLGFLTSSKI